MVVVATANKDGGSSADGNVSLAVWFVAMMMRMRTLGLLVLFCMIDVAENEACMYAVIVMHRIA